VIGGGAAGFFAAITCAETFPDAEVTILEKGAQFLSKVRISGGGRCNVTNACTDPKELSTSYPRGGQSLLGPLHRFGSRETVAWFEDRGVKLKTEPDGRMFPVTNSSQTVIDCLMRSAQRAGVHLVTGRTVTAVQKTGTESEPLFTLSLQSGDKIDCERLMIASGGCRSPAAAQIPISLGHTLLLPVPSLFTFHLAEDWVRALAGISLPLVELSVPDTKLRQRGPLLITHSGVSGPATLKLSAWAAREMHRCNYNFPLLVNWLPELSQDGVAEKLEQLRARNPAKLIVNTPVSPLSSRLWEALVIAAKVSRETRWSVLSRQERHALVQTLSRCEFKVVGKTLNQEEFVTCGGIPLNEVNFKTMESRVCPGLFFAGEVLDIDGVTGGFNFQAAWTTGWMAGNAMGRS
jgi:predicted Rossmann fold flavoprotein